MAVIGCQPSVVRQTENIGCRWRRRVAIVMWRSWPSCIQWGVNHTRIDLWVCECLLNVRQVSATKQHFVAELWPPVGMKTAKRHLALLDVVNRSKTKHTWFCQEQQPPDKLAVASRRRPFILRAVKQPLLWQWLELLTSSRRRCCLHTHTQHLMTFLLLLTVKNLHLKNVHLLLKRLFQKVYFSVHRKMNMKTTSGTKWRRREEQTLGRLIYCF